MKSIIVSMMTAVMLLSFLQGKSQPASGSSKKSLDDVYEKYFALKDALVSSDGSASSEKAKALLKSLEAVDMEQLSADAHEVWMKVKDAAMEDAEHIGQTKEIAHQRDHFTSLSENMYTLMKASKLTGPVYYQHCPMANNGKGANWLSLQKEIKNPYYGSKMLTCGSTKETIQK